MKPSASLSYEFFALTDVGRVRANNEDAVAIHPQERVMLLADGMGGYNAGEVASDMAVSGIGRAMCQWLQKQGADLSTSQIRQQLELSVDEANADVFLHAQNYPQFRGMGTTLVVGVFLENWLVLGHIGDSRCYRLRGGTLRQITRDHSLLQEQIDAGLITPEQAAVSTQRNLVTRALGVDPVVLLELNEFTVEPQDLFILCSDGLSEMLSHAALQDLAMQPGSLKDKAHSMVSLANAMGGRDNISVVLAQVGGSAAPEKKRSLVSRLLNSF